MRPLREIRMNVVVVGQGPNRTCWTGALARAERHNWFGKKATEWAEEFCARLSCTGSVGAKLSALAGITATEFYRSTTRVNLNRRWKGKSGKGDAFDRTEGQIKARQLLLQAETGTRFVILGKSAAECFDLEGEPLTVVERDGKRFLLLPHPSGINTWWNTPENKLAARHALMDFLRQERDEKQEIAGRSSTGGRENNGSKRQIHAGPRPAHPGNPSRGRQGTATRDR